MKLFNFDTFILNEKILLENRIENLENKYKNIISNNVLDWFESHDPTSNGAYLEWMLKKYSELDPIEKENLEKLKTPIYKIFTKTINKFNNIKNKLSNKNKDINNYNTINQLINKVIEEDKDYSNETIKKYGNVDILINNVEWFIFTPYDFEVAEEYGHNNRGGKNWCVCYDQDYFYEYFCPDGGITMIINKLDPKLDLAIQKSKDGEITLWDYNDKSVSKFDYRSNELEKYLKNHDGYEFVIDFFSKNPIKNKDLPDVSREDVIEKWIDFHIDEFNLLKDSLDKDEYEYYLNFNKFSHIVYNDLKESEKEKNDFISKQYYLDYIKSNYNLENMNKNNINKLENNINLMKKFIIKKSNWNTFFYNWFNDVVDNDFLINLLYNEVYEPDERFFNIDDFLKNFAENEPDEELYRNYYEY